MRSISLSIAVLGVVVLFASGTSSASDIELPTLHQIKEVTLSPNYGCRSPEEFAGGYKETALFLSDYGRKHNSPDLLFNGACGSDDYFEAATAGDDMSLIADLGADVPLSDISAIRAFNVERVHSFSSYSMFARAVKVELYHTYAVLLNAQDKRGLFVFTVVDYVPNKKVALKYAVESYQVTKAGVISSPGFQWDQKNTF